MYRRTTVINMFKIMIIIFLSLLKLYKVIHLKYQIFDDYINYICPKAPRLKKINRDWFFQSRLIFVKKTIDLDWFFQKSIEKKSIDFCFKNQSKMPLKINRKINRKCSNIHQGSEMFVDFFKLVGSHVLAVVHIHVIYIYICVCVCGIHGFHRGYPAQLEA